MASPGGQVLTRAAEHRERRFGHQYGGQVRSRWAGRAECGVGL